MAWRVIPPKRQKPGRLVGGMWVIFQAWPIANLSAVGMLGPAGAKITSGYGTWEVSQVPRNVGITEWKGRTNYAMTIDLLYDGWLQHPIRPNLPASFINPPRLPKNVRYARRGQHMETAVTNLERLATPQRGMTTPPSVRIIGAIPHPEVRWVIQSLDWGDVIRDRNTGRRMRQQVTVNLLEYYQPRELQKLPRGNADGKTKPKPKAKPKPKPKAKARA